MAARLKTLCEMRYETEVVTEESGTLIFTIDFAWLHVLTVYFRCTSFSFRGPNQFGALVCPKLNPV